MLIVLRNLPLYDSAQTIRAEGVEERMMPFQIPIWVTLCRKGRNPYDERATLIPAILDTGYNGYFCLREEHMRRAGLDPKSFGPLFRTVDSSRGCYDVRPANIWLHRNVPSSVNPTREAPIHLELDEGVTVFRPPQTAEKPEHKDPRPRLPLLGMRALRRNDLCLSIDFRRAVVNLTRPRWFFLTWGV